MELEIKSEADGQFNEHIGVEPTQDNQKESVVVEPQNIDDLNVRKELQEKTDVGLQSYLKYVKLGKTYQIFILILVMLIYMVSLGYSYYFYNTLGSSQSNDYHSFLKGFVFINMVIGTTQFLRLLICYLFGINISLKLHSLMILRILYASINSFFNKNSVGKVLNRLSGDLQDIDRSIGYSQAYFANNVSIMLINIILMMIFTHWVIGVVFAVVILFLWRSRKSFSIANILTTKYDQVTKSPYFALISDFVNGNHEIRTFDFK